MNLRLIASAGLKAQKNASLGTPGVSSPLSCGEPGSGKFPTLGHCPPCLKDTETGKAAKLPNSYMSFGLKRDRYIKMDEKAYAIALSRRTVTESNNNRPNFTNALTSSNTVESDGGAGTSSPAPATPVTATTSGGTVFRGSKSPKYFHDNHPQMSNLPVVPDLEQLVHRSTYDVITILASRSVHCNPLQSLYPAIHFIPLTTHPDTELFDYGKDIKHYQYNIFMGQTPDSNHRDMIHLVQSMFFWWISKDATLHGLRTVHPQNSNKNGQNRHFHTFNMHQEWWVPANHFFKQAVLLEPGGAWIGLGPEGQRELQAYIAEFKRTSGQVRHRIGTPTNLLVLELSGENGGAGGKAKTGRRKYAQPPPVPTSANPMVQPGAPGGNFPAGFMQDMRGGRGGRGMGGRGGMGGIDGSPYGGQMSQQQMGMYHTNSADGVMTPLGMTGSYSNDFMGATTAGGTNDGFEGVGMTPTNSFEGGVGGFQGGGFGTGGGGVRVGNPAFMGGGANKMGGPGPAAVPTLHAAPLMGSKEEIPSTVGVKNDVPDDVGDSWVVSS